MIWSKSKFLNISYFILLLAVDSRNKSTSKADKQLFKCVCVCVCVPSGLLTYLLTYLLHGAESFLSS